MRLRAGLLAALCLAACRAKAPPPSPPPVAVASGVIVTALPLDSAGRPRGLPPIPDSLMRRARLLADSAALQTDTLVPLVDSLVLHVGETILALPMQLVQARRADGTPVRRFAPMMSVENSAIAEFGPDGLTALRAGQTRLVVRPVVLNSQSMPHASPIYIRVVVQP